VTRERPDTSGASAASTYPGALPRTSRPVIDYLRTGLQAGMVVPNPADPTLKTIRVTAP
jgi:arginine decarboxylase